MDLNIELKNLSLNLELKPLEVVELNLSLDETKSLTGRVFQEDIAESILMGYYAIKNLINWFA